MTSFSGVTFGLFCFALLFFIFRLYAFVEAAALRSIVLRYAGAPIASRVFFFSFLFVGRCRFFRVFFVPFPLSLCMESRSYVLSFQMFFFYLVTTGWIFYISYVRTQSTNQDVIWYFQHAHFIPIMGVGRRGEYQLVHGDLPRQNSFGTTLRFTGLVAADSRQ